jgi:hypothetical protein
VSQFGKTKDTKGEKEIFGRHSRPQIHTHTHTHTHAHTHTYTHKYTIKTQIHILASKDFNVSQKQQSIRKH